MNDQQADQLLSLLGVIAASLERLAAAQDDPDEAPDLERPLGDYKTFDWASIGASVRDRDDDGPTLVECHGHLWKRRSPENQFGAVVFFSRWIGRDAEGRNQYARLITFKPVSEAQPVSRKAERELKAAPAPGGPGGGTTPIRDAVRQPAVTGQTQQGAAHVPSKTQPAPSSAAAAENTAAVIAGLDGTVRATQPPLPPTDGSDYFKADRPWTVNQVKAALHDAAQKIAARTPNEQANGTWGAAIDVMERIGVNERKAFLAAVWNVASSKDMTEAQKIATARWVKPTKDQETGQWIPGEHFRREFAAVINAAMFPED